MAMPAVFFPPRPVEGPTQFVERMLTYARTLLDVPYEINLPGEVHIPGSRGFGKIFPDPDFGLDCSGFVLNVLQHMGVLSELDPLFTNCDRLSEFCDEVAQEDTVPGDLVFFSGTFETSDQFSHIGIVTEAAGRRMIDAREPHVMEEPLRGGVMFQFLAQYGRVRGMPS
jgi:cell wall-associated NlpC family hydrolase